MLIEFLIIAIDILFTVLLTLFCVPTGHYYHYWAPFLLLIAGYIVGMILLWTILSIFGAFYPKNKEYKKPSKLANFLLSIAVEYICIHAGVKLKVQYNEPFPEEKFLLVCNHLSRFDPMIVAAKFKKQRLAFISKPSNFKIPIGGHFMKASCYMAIDRLDKLKSLEVMKEANRLISENLSSVGVYPEGSRQDGPEHLAEFHEGVFAVAIKANCPIVVTSIKGTENIHKNFPFKTSKVELKILKVIYPNQYIGRTSKSVSDEAHQLIKESLN